MTPGSPARTSRTASAAAPSGRDSGQAPEPASSPEGRPLRRDAQRTRRLVLAAARELFAERGLEVGFDEIARVAGVGVGTVYRRFPTREALVAALFTERAEEVVAHAAEALAVADPWQAIVEFCERTIIERQRDQGLAEVLSNGRHGHEHLDDLREQMGTILGELLDRAQRAGVVRADLDPTDLALIAHLLGRVATDDGSEIWRRYLSLFFDGIRARPGIQPLAEPAPSVQILEEVAQRL